MERIKNRIKNEISGFLEINKNHWLEELDSEIINLCLSFILLHRPDKKEILKEMLEIIKNLCSHSPLLPLQGTKEEWKKIDKQKYENLRSPLIFKDTKGAYNLISLIFDDNGQEYTQIELKNGIIIESKLYIPKFPFVPKPFRIKVKKLKNGKFKIIDIKKLVEAFSYYGKDYNFLFLNNKGEKDGE